jgi:hypothetical protein
MGGGAGPSPMGSRFCANCGQPVVPGSAFCPSCGAPVAGVVPPPAAPASTPAGMPLNASAYAGYPAVTGSDRGPSPATRPADLLALSSVTIAAIIGLVGTIASLATLFVRSATSISAATQSNGSVSFTLSATQLDVLAAAAGVGLLFWIAEVLLYRRAFRTLARHDPRLSTPSILMMVALIGLAIIVAAGAGLVVLLYQAVQCAGPGNPITTACLNFSGAGGLGLLLGLGAVLAVIGYIGLLVGIWRLGTRYGESMFQAGAVLLLFPFLNVIGVILILVAARSVHSRIAGPEVAATFG